MKKIVKAWGLKAIDGTLLPWVFDSRKEESGRYYGAKICTPIRVEIREVTKKKRKK